MLDPSGSNSHTFGRRSRAQAAEAQEEKYEDDYEEDDEDCMDEAELAREVTFQEDIALPRNAQTTDKKNNEVNQAVTQVMQSSFYRRDLIDPKTVDQKKRLLYDKSLKAYYDPETGQYFEMKAQLIP